MSTPKYVLLDEGRDDKLFRLKALRDFGNVKAGDLGGLVAGEHNLSHEGACWVYGDARVLGRARVGGNAKVSGDALVCGNAKVYDNAWVYGNAEVYDNAWVYGNAEVYGSARVYGNSKVFCSARVFGNARVCGRAKLSSTSDYTCVGPIGSRNAYTTFWMQAGVLYAATGCFYGTVDRLLKRSAKRPVPGARHKRDYRDAVEFAEKLLKRREVKP